MGVVGKEGAAKMNKTIWQEAARGWEAGRLAGIFVRSRESDLALADVQIECSYDSDRPAALMFGHISPPGLYYELKTLASLLNKNET